MLELVWVNNPAEARSPATRGTRLANGGRNATGFARLESP